MVHNQRGLQTFCAARSPHRSTAGVLEVSLSSMSQVKPWSTKCNWEMVHDVPFLQLLRTGSVFSSSLIYVSRRDTVCAETIHATALPQAFDGIHLLAHLNMKPVAMA